MTASNNSSEEEEKKGGGGEVNDKSECSLCQVIGLIGLPGDWSKTNQAESKFGISTFNCLSCIISGPSA